MNYWWPHKFPAHNKTTAQNLVLHLRAETKPFERRSALTPTTVGHLLESGWIVIVERSPRRIFDDEEFEAVGATMAPEGSWIFMPQNHVIIGLKQLPESDAPTSHLHIHFGHCYKDQEGWDRYLFRFARGGGTLYDIEFLVDQSGKRISAFGFFAGFAGAAVALLAWSHKILLPNNAVPAIPAFYSVRDVREAIKTLVASAVAKNGNQYPRVLVMGAQGQCGHGAICACYAADIPSSHWLKWDTDETAAGGPFPEITASDIFINCVNLQGKVPPFITFESLAKPDRKLRIACDVSCDYNSPNNPMPIYHQSTTFTHPTLPIDVGSGPSLDVICIDNLPSLVAREASEAFSMQLLPSLKRFHRRREEGVWLRAEAKFREKVRELPANMLGGWPHYLPTRPS